MDAFFKTLDAINGVMLGVPVLVALLGVGVLFTLWSRFIQYRSLTHGIRLLRGQVPGVSGHGSGALSHFQALCAALSATVGLGNIGGVAIAVAIGGPGAVFWMWVVGFFGMALKATEVLLALIYRDLSDPDEPHGGTMWVCKRGFAELSPKLARLGAFVGALFTLPLIFYGLFGGNMFQAWNVAEITRAYFGVPGWITGAIVALTVGAVILGGIRRIGQITNILVPVMCALYIIASLYVLAVYADRIPATFVLIFKSAFSSAEAGGAFIGASMGTAFILGMRRALFSSEAGLGSAPIAHAAVKTPQPVTEGIVAGLEPFIDTLVICTMTALVILVSGMWNRDAIIAWDQAPALVQTAPQQWQPAAATLPALDRAKLNTGDQVFIVTADADGAREKLFGTLNAHQQIDWRPLTAARAPQVVESGIFADYPASTLTARAFDAAHQGLGRWMVTLAVWAFAVSTIITWCYYAEQGVIYLLGARAITPFRLLWCALTFIACLGLIRTDAELDTLSTVAVGFMIAINLPIMLILGHKAMRAYALYLEQLKAGTLAHPSDSTP
ncbi:sodium:alanine symporter family protein [Sinimarinibacterium sp. NLF-5-8]|uniref:alanine/glycine:cation symporter family protein n=1 Tax=Sinimarinibacterium sp. NLF-5-8 TaxID=2698684 RepID=UPI00137C0F7B|nr:amino acid carrier protein [Sinimarinibacterium sp. NLF-5-8]QHS10088.1 sodium:alanine symporter family protein [Sinimarinibacterium sp. NLF-5-8]